MWRRSWLALALASGLVLGSATARAGGFEIPDLGTIPLGRGTAFTAKADSLAAFHYNPAGLSKLSGPNVLLSVNVVNVELEFTRGGRGGPVLPPWNTDDMYPQLVLDPGIDFNTGEPYAPVSNAKKFGPSPLVAAAWGDVGVEGLTIAVGVMPPVGFGAHDWPGEGSQRYTMTQGDFFFLQAGAGLAYRFNRYISVGAIFLNGFFTSDFRFRSRSYSQANNMFQNEDLFRDNTVRIKTKDLFVPSGSIGLLSNPLDWLELGVSVRLPMHVRSTGSLAYTPSEETPDARLASKSKVTLEQQFPTVLRSGIRYIHEVFDVELDFVYENYGSVDTIEAKFENPDADFAPVDEDPVSPLDDRSLLYLETQVSGNTVHVPMIPTPVTLGWRDTYSLRLGSDVKVWPEHLTIRAGGWYATSAYTRLRQSYSIRFPWDEQVGIGTGFTWHIIPQLDFSFAFQHIFQDDVVVKEGFVQAPSFREIDSPNVFGNVVNNGVYSTNINVFGFALEAHF